MSLIHPTYNRTFDQSGAKAAREVDMSPEVVNFEDGSSANFYNIAQLEHVRNKQREAYWSSRKVTLESDTSFSVATRVPRRGLHQ